MGPSCCSQPSHCQAHLAGERSSPADLDSYKAWRASRAAKQISIAPSARHPKSPDPTIPPRYEPLRPALSAPRLRKLIWNLQHLATHCAGGLGL